MNIRVALVAGLLSTLAAVAGCARPETAAARQPFAIQPVVAYGLATDHTERTLSLEQPTRGETVAVAPIQKRDTSVYLVNRSSRSR